MSLSALFGTDKNLERNGVRIEYSSGPEDKNPPTFIIARSGGANTKFNDEMENALRPMRRRLALDQVKNPEMAKITKDVFCKTVLKGWENVTDDSGNPIEFNEQNARALFDKLPDLFDDLEAQSRRAATFRLDSLEAAAGN